MNTHDFSQIIQYLGIFVCLLSHLYHFISRADTQTFGWIFFVVVIFFLCFRILSLTLLIFLVFFREKSSLLSNQYPSFLYNRFQSMLHISGITQIQNHLILTDFLSSLSSIFVNHSEQSLLRNQALTTHWH